MPCARMHRENASGLAFEDACDALLDVGVPPALATPGPFVLLPHAAANKATSVSAPNRAAAHARRARRRGVVRGGWSVDSM